MSLALFFYFASFVAIWFAAGIVVTSVDRISHKLKLSSFAVSFFVLGMLTSIPEISVGINAVIERDPEIFVGNLIGGIIVIFLLIIPFLAIFGNGARLVHQMEHTNLVFALLVIAAPSIFTLDGKITFSEGLFSVLLYSFLVYVVEKKKGLLERVKDNLFHNKDHLLIDLLKIMGGVITVFLASKYVVDMTIYFSVIFDISPFLISLILISLGTNLPELSLVVRSLMLKKKEVAFGDYLGSAAANTAIFGGLVLLMGRSIVVDNNFFKTFVFIIVGLALFFFFARSKNDISRKEGLILLLLYFFFLIVEVI